MVELKYFEQGSDGNYYFFLSGAEFCDSDWMISVTKKEITVGCIFQDWTSGDFKHEDVAGVLMEAVSLYKYLKISEYSQNSPQI